MNQKRAQVHVLALFRGIGHEVSKTGCQVDLACRTPLMTRASRENGRVMICVAHKLLLHRRTHRPPVHDPLAAREAFAGKIIVAHFTLCLIGAILALHFQIPVTQVGGR
jgi:hypothetical protein